MQKVLISLSDQLACRMKAVIPDRQRSKVISLLLTKEIENREKVLYECALAVEQDEELKKDMALWDITSGDGVDSIDQEE